MTTLVLVILGIVTGAVSVVLGGGYFWAVPVWQILFPQISFGVLVGNLKVGSLFRGISSTRATWNQTNHSRALLLSIPLLAGSVIGAFSISKLDQKWTVVALILAAIVVECSPWLASKAKRSHFLLGCILLGIYFGFFGAGGGVLIIALLRIRTPEDSEVASLKSEARFIELLMAIVAVAAHFLAGNIVNNLWIPWSIGNFIGGDLGGRFLNKLGSMPGRTQKAVLRVSYLLAIVLSVLTALVRRGGA